MPRFGASIYSICNPVMSGKVTPEYALEWLAEQGAEVIELTSFVLDPVSDPSLIERILRVTEKTGVPVANYSINANFLMLTPEEHEQEIAKAKRHIDAAHSLSVPNIRIDCAGFRRPLESNTIENFQMEVPTILHTYRILCDYAAQYGMSVLLENHGFHVNGSERVRQILMAVDRDNFGHQLDVGNYICVDDIPEISVRKMISFAKTIHMKDFYVRSIDRDPGDATQFDCSGSWFRSINGRFLRGSLLAQGDLDIYAIMKTIKDSGYDGDFFLEYEGIEDCYYATKVSIDNMKRIYSLV